VIGVPRVAPWTSTRTSPSSLILTLIHATGLALVIAAVLAGARPTFPIPQDDRRIQAL